MQWHRQVPMLLCKDVRVARDFYKDILGMTVSFDLGWFVSLEKKFQDKASFELSLCDADHDSLPSALRTPVDGLVLTFQVDDVETVLAAFERSGVPIVSKVVDEPWGQRHFFAAAPDGVSLDVFQPIPPNPVWMRENGLST